MLLERVHRLRLADRLAVALVFRCRPVSGTPTPSDETTAVTWLTPEQAETAMRSVYAIRVHDGLH